MSLDRRDLLKQFLLTAATGGLLGATASDRPVHGESPSGNPASERPWEIIDVNVSLFQWPFRRLPGDTLEGLVDKLRAWNITQAWAGSYEGLLHRDLAGVNARLAEACRSVEDDLLVPFGSVNLELPAWETDIRRCHEEYAMPGIRLHPNYHGYTLEDPRFERLLTIARERGLLVQLAVSLEDGRTQHPRLQVSDVNLAPLPGVMAKVPGVRVMLLNYKPPRSLPEPLVETGGLSFDTARVDATDGIERLMNAVSPERVLFGTHAPFLIYEAGLIKVYESQLSEPQIRHLLSENARRSLSQRA
jgi:uncharacterized protein